MNFIPNIILTFAKVELNELGSHFVYKYDVLL